FFPGQQWTCSGISNRKHQIPKTDPAINAKNKKENKIAQFYNLLPDPFSVRSPSDRHPNL
ncbi:MAG: hypothetical protein JXQ96_09900, partial [Cyclobacteriaceae bacterium]